MWSISRGSAAATAQATAWLDDPLEQPLALVGRHELGIADAGNVTVGMQHDRRRHDRSRQTAAPDLVDPGHMAEADAPQRVLQRTHGRHAHHRQTET